MAFKPNVQGKYAKFGFRILNVHKWHFKTEDFDKVMYGITVFGICIDFSIL